MVCHQFFISSSSVLHQFFISSSSILHQLFISSSSALHQLFISSSSVLHQFFISSPSVLHQFFISSLSVLFICIWQFVQSVAACGSYFPTLANKQCNNLRAEGAKADVWHPTIDADYPSYIFSISFVFLNSLLFRVISTV